MWILWDTQLVYVADDV